MVHSIGQNYVDVMGELWEFFGFYQGTIAVRAEPFGYAQEILVDK